MSIYNDEIQTDVDEAVELATKLRIIATRLHNKGVILTFFRIASGANFGEVATATLYDGHTEHNLKQLAKPD